jgi:hypothetical protein
VRFGDQWIADRDIPHNEKAAAGGRPAAAFTAKSISRW